MKMSFSPNTRVSLSLVSVHIYCPLGTTINYIDKTNQPSINASMAEVTYIGKRTTVSTKPVEPGKYFQLSVLDRLMEKNHLRIVYYYRIPGRWGVGEVTNKLTDSLSEMLTSFPIVTGRLQKNEEGHWMVKCNDAGVRIMEARARGSVEEWLKSMDRERELKLIHWEAMTYDEPYFWATFYVQLTEFEGDGLSIGLSCSHLLADSTCAIMFIKTWLETTLSGKMMSPPLFHPLPSRNPGSQSPSGKPCSQLINQYKSLTEKSNIETVHSKQLGTITLAFTDPMVRACMAMAGAATAPDQLSPSPFEALAGLFWVCVSKAIGPDQGLLEMSICVNRRKILGLDDGFFGNCMIYNKVPADAGFSEEKELSGAAVAIQEAMATMDRDGIMDLIEWLQCNDNQSHVFVNGCDLICASLEDVDPYFALFTKEVLPIRVSHYVEPVRGVGQVLILPSARNEGPLSRVVMVTLPVDELVKLREDDLILQFSPTILMDINKI